MREHTNRPRAGVVLAALFAGTFVMGCAEVVVTGMLDLMALDLRVDVAVVGSLVSANALGIAIGGPLLTFLTARLDRRRVLLAALTVFTALNLLPVIGTGLEVFAPARFVIGAVEGLFIAAAITTSTSIVPPERVGRAMAAVISGFAVSGAVGMPLGRLLGESIGWRWTYLAVVIAAALVLAASVVVLPRVASQGAVETTGRLRAAFAPRVVAVLLVGVLLFAAVQSALTYLVPFLGDVTGISGWWIGFCLMGFGVAAAAGSFAAGRFADAGAARALTVGCIGATAALGALFLAGSNPVVAVSAILVLGVCSAGITTPWQHRVEHLAGPGAVVAASLPASAGNLGDALGAFAGGQAIGVGGTPAAVLVATVVAAVAAAVAVAGRTLRPATGTPAEVAAVAAPGTRPAAGRSSARGGSRTHWEERPDRRDPTAIRPEEHE